MSFCAECTIRGKVFFFVGPPEGRSGAKTAFLKKTPKEKMKKRLQKHALRAILICAGGTRTQEKTAALSR